MKKICIIMPAFMSVPSKKSGSVEILMSVIYENYENSKLKNENDFEIDFFSKTQIKLNFIDRFLFNIYRFMKKVFKKKIFAFDRYYYKVYKKVKKGNYDLCIIEAGDVPKLEGLMKNLSKIVEKEKIVYHNHLDLGYLDDKYLKMLSGNVGKFINVSDYINDKMITQLGVEKNQTEVLRNCTEEDDFKTIPNNKKEKIRKHMKFKKDDFILLYVGRIVEEKGISELIEVVQELNNPKVKLVCCGSDFNKNSKDTPFIINLRKKAENLKNQIFFTGYITHDQLAKYYQIGDVLVIPSKWEEPSGLVAIEGLLNGIPIIATKSGGMTEYLSEGSAILIEKDENLKENLKNEIMRIKDDEELKKRLSKKALEKSKEYSKQSFYSNFVKIVNKYMNENEDISK